MAVVAVGGGQRGARETSCRRRIEGMVAAGWVSRLASGRGGNRSRGREMGSNKCGERGY
jgi:hypothetical protein